MIKCISNIPLGGLYLHQPNTVLGFTEKQEKNKTSDGGAKPMRDVDVKVTVALKLDSMTV